MKFRGSSFWIAILLGGWIFALLTPSVFAAFDTAEEVKVISRTPDKSNPLYETDEVEGGISFHVPKGTAFVRKYGVISPVDSLEYLVKKYEGLKGQTEALSKRVDVLEKNAENASDKKN